MNIMPNYGSMWKSIRQWSVALAVLIALSVPALALADALPPPATLKKNPPAWMGMGLMFILVGLVVGVSLLPAKRGHQD